VHEDETAPDRVVPRIGLAAVLVNDRPRVLLEDVERILPQPHPGHREHHQIVPKIIGRDLHGSESQLLVFLRAVQAKLACGKDRHRPGRKVVFDDGIVLIGHQHLAG